MNLISVADLNLLYRLTVLTDGYKLLITDLTDLYIEELNDDDGNDEILRRCTKLNPAVEVTDASDLLVELGRIVESPKSKIKTQFSG